MRFLREVLDKFQRTWSAGVILMLVITIIVLIPTIGIFLASPFIACLAQYGRIVWSENRSPQLKELFSLPFSHYLRVGIVWAGIFAVISAILLLYIKSKIDEFPHLASFASPGYLLPLAAGALIAVTAYFLLYSYPFLIIEHSQKVGPAISRSIQLSLSYPRYALALTLSVLALNVAGLLFYVVGILITVPITFIAAAGIYAKVQSEEKYKSYANDLRN